jgi:SEFIR domain
MTSQDLSGHNPPKVFISYSHNYECPDYKDRILSLADRLLTDGIDCNIDQYEESPLEGWQRWMLNQVDWADFILIACTEEYHQRFRGNETQGKGKGATWEGAIIIQELYDAQNKNSKFIPIVLDSRDFRYIPTPLRSATHYVLDTDDGYESLYRRLTGQAKIKRPKLGKLQKLAPRNRKQDFKIVQKVNTVNQPTVSKNKTSQPKKVNFAKITRENNRSKEIQGYITTINNYQNHSVEEVGKALKRLRIIARGNPKAIQSVSNLLSGLQKRLAITLDAVSTLEKIAKNDEESVKTAIQKVISVWDRYKDKNTRKIIIRCLSEIGDGNNSAINKLVSLLRYEKDSVLIQFIANSLAKIGVGYENVRQAIETKITLVPAKPKVLRNNLVKNLKIIDPGNSVAAQYSD